MHELPALHDRISSAALGRLRLRLRPMLRQAVDHRPGPAQSPARHDEGHHKAARAGEARRHRVSHQDYGCPLSAEEWRIAARLQAEGVI